MNATTPIRISRYPWACKCGLAWRGSDERCDKCGQLRCQGAVIWSEVDARRMEFAQYLRATGRICG